MARDAERKRRVRLIQWGAAGTLIVVLEVICRAGWVRPTTLVPPSVMLVAMGEALTDPATLGDFAVTLLSVAAAALISAALGVAGGILLHAAPRLRRAFEPFIASYYALPLFALYPVLVVVFGVGPRPIIATGVLYAMMSVVIGTLAGLDRIPRVFRKVARVQRLGRLDTIRRVLVPACVPEILGGIALSVSYAFVAVVASEFLLAPRGIGHAIANSYSSFRTREMYGLLLGLGVCVIVINWGLHCVRLHLTEGR